MNFYAGYGQVIAWLIAYTYANIIKKLVVLINVEVLCSF